MADRSAGTVTLRLAVKDGEVVRGALEQLGKDGQRVINILDRASRQPAAGVKAVNETISESRSILQGWAGQLGAAGNLVSRLGPVGLAAAGALGGLALSFYKLSQSAHDYAAEQLKLRDTAQTLDLTTTQLDALIDGGSEFALTAEKVSAGLQRMNSKLEEARAAQGELFDKVNDISPALATELAGARDLAAAIDVLGKAYRATDDAAKKAALSRAAFGRTGFDVGLLVQRIAENGGVQALTAEFVKSGDAIDPKLTERVAKLKAEIDDMANDARRNIASIFSEQILSVQHQYTEEVREVTRLIKDGEFLAAAKQAANSIAGIFSGGKFRPFAPQSREPTKVTVNAPQQFGPDLPATVPLSPEARLNMERQRISILGDAATATDRLRLRQLELAVATHQGAIFQGEANRSLQRTREELEATAVATRTQLGIATTQEREHQIEVDIARKTAEGYIRTEEERATAISLATKALREQIDQERIRASYTPELTRFAIESADTLKAVDQVSTQAFRSVADGLSDVVLGTKDVKSAFTDMATSIVRDLIRITVQKSITGPLAESLSGLLPGLLGTSNLATAGVGSTGPSLGSFVLKSALGNVFSGGNVVRFDRGGIVDRMSYFALANGGVASIAENNRAEAVMPLKRIDGRLGVDASGVGQAINVTSTVQNYAGAPGVEQRVSRKRGGGLSIETIIPAIETRLADRMARGQGGLAKVAETSPLRG